jgi:hypothetical protein
LQSIYFTKTSIKIEKENRTLRKINPLLSSKAIEREQETVIPAVCATNTHWGKILFILSLKDKRQRKLLILLIGPRFGRRIR